MAFDGIVLSALVGELQDRLAGGRIDRIQQPTGDDLVLTIRSQRSNYRLLLSSNKAHPRIHLSAQFALPSPIVAPMFCMLMRKHLEGGRIREIAQIGRERIAYIDIDARNELGDVVTRRLMIEIMGKHSNIVLLAEADGVIIDATNHTPASVNRHREVLPGRRYVYPPAQAKIDPYLEDGGGFSQKRASDRAPLSRFLVDHYVGVSPFLGKETEFEVNQRQTAAAADEWETFSALLARAKRLDQPAVVFDEQHRPVAFYAFIPRHVTGDVRTYASLSEALDVYYEKLAVADIIRSKTSNYLRLAKNEVDKNRNKISKLSAQLDAREEAENWRLQGELLTAYLYQLKKGEAEVTLPDFYHDNQPLTITMDPAKTPLENANSFFRRYQKYNKGLHKTEEQLELAKHDLVYWESVVHELESATFENLPLIEAELREAGLLKKNFTLQAVRQKKAASSYAAHQSSDGTPILVGRNNQENDHLTFRVAKKSDYWLHAKDAPGSHVILKGDAPSEQTLYEAALLAAYYSKMRTSAKAQVDVVQVKDLWKPNHARPGFVLFTGQRTLMVAMDDEVINRLLHSLNR